MKNYDASSIKVLKGLEPVRKRPGMYIGSTDINGLHHLVWEIVDNSVDEVLAGHATNISVTLKKDGSVIVEDNGRGIPIDKHSSGKSAVEVIFTELHSGGKFSSDGAYKTSGGLHGVGSSVVNALSKKLIVKVFKNKKEYETIFENGESITQKTKVVGSTKKTGTLVQFWPDYSIFKNARLNFDRISERLRESSFLISNLEISVVDEKAKKKETFKFENGLSAFVEFINENRKKLTPAGMFQGKESGIEVDVAFQYTDAFQETILSFVNNVKTKDGGTHEVGFKTGWTKVINEFIKNSGTLKSNKSLEGDDIREGLTAVISIRIPEDKLEFVGQTKDKLGTPEAKGIIESVISEKLNYWLIENKKPAERILKNASSAASARLAARKARDEVRKLKKTKRAKVILSGKLTPAQSKEAQLNELFLVEGDSAGGSAKMGRDRKFQAILPLRGKVINSEKAKLLDILKNEEIATIINTIGAGIGNEFNIDDVNYGKVIIMTDADTDGAHIQILLLTFFFRFMKPLVEAGKVYVALPPLYKVENKSNFDYAWDDIELKDLLKKIRGGTIQRYKGLGEMNAQQLWDTTMNPETRTLIKVQIDDQAIVERRVTTLMGGNIEGRKKWIERNIDFSLEDDFSLDQVNGEAE